MAYLEGSMGAMLQGVSQQPARLRTEGQVSEQINYDSDVSNGLTSRPGTTDIAVLASATAGMKFRAVEHLEDTYLMGFGTGVLKMWDLNGSEITVSGATSYVGTAMEFFSDSETGNLIMLNRNKVTAMSPTVVGRPFHAATVTCLGGLFSRTYSITVTDDEGNSRTVTFNTPDGTTEGDADKTSSTYIADILSQIWASAAVASIHPKLAATTVELSGSTLVIKSTTPIIVTADDGEGGSTLRAADDTVQDVTHLAKTSLHGHIVKVQGSASEDDDYFLRFDSNVATVEGTGFGTDGVWREVADPDEAHGFNLSTMPHVISVSGSTATVSTGAWEPRAAGNEVSNPTPAFVGDAIRDLGVFEGRLVSVGGGHMRTSRNEQLYDWWKQSATVDADDDPIEIRSTASSGITLDWIIPFDGDLLLVSDPGAGQFIVRGGGMTPSNASMVLSTEYEVFSGVRPVSTGRTIMLPFVSGGYVGINEFFTNDGTSSTNAADALTAIQDRYIPGSTTHLQSAENFRRFVLASTGDPKTLWVYRYLWNGSERLQSAWYKQTFTDDVQAFFFDSQYMYAVLRSATETALVRMDMNRSTDTVGYHVTLDRKVTAAVAGGAVTTSLQNAQVVQSTGCESPGLFALVDNTVDNGNGTYTLTLETDQCPNGSTVILGHKVTRTLQPTMPVPKSFSGQVVSRAALSLRDFYVHMSDSGDIKATFESPYRATREFFPRTVPMDSDPLDPNRLGKRDYVLTVPWREEATRSTLTLTSDDPRPDTILEIEWSGDQRGVRRRI